MSYFFIKPIKKSFKNGFTLLEVMLAIFFLTVGIGGAFMVIQRTVGLSSISASRLIAANLAQEGIEIVRNIRDTNWLDSSNPGWNDGLGAGDYEADYNCLDLTVCSPCQFSDMDFLRIDSVNGFYNYTLGNDTKFKRKITIADCSPADIDCLKVIVDVAWQERGTTHNFMAQEYLYNWK